MFAFVAELFARSALLDPSGINNLLSRSIWYTGGREYYRFALIERIARLAVN